MDNTTKQVAEMYTKFPFPSMTKDTLTLRWSYDLDFLLAVADSKKQIHQIRVLDAGAGTGEMLVGCASVFPDVDFTAIELSPTSLAIAKKNADYLGVENIRFFQKDIMELTPTDFGTFDIIICSGVIHHLSEPDRGLNKLVEFLGTNGIMPIYLYCQYSREPNIRIKEAVNIIESDPAKYKKRIRISRAFTNNYSANDASMVDAYLHVNERLYTAKSIFELLTKAGLKFIRFRDEPMWDPEELIKDAEIATIVRSLPESLRYEALDLVFSQAITRGSYELLAGSASKSHSSQFGAVDNSHLDKFPMRTPFISIAEGPDEKGYVEVCVHHSDSHPLRLRVTKRSVNLIMKCTGKKCLRDILEEVSPDITDNRHGEKIKDELITFFDYAQNYDLIYFRPVPAGKKWEQIKRVDFSKA